MTTASGEQLKTDFEQSLRELCTLTSQIRANMPRGKRIRSQKQSPAANANTANANANAAETPTVGTSTATANTAGNPDPPQMASSCKDSLPVVFSNMHDYLGGEAEVPFEEDLRMDKDLFPPLPISPAATSITASSSPTSPAPKAPRRTEPVSADAMTTLLSEFSSLRQLLNSRADALESMIIKNSVAIAAVKEEGRENTNQINAMKVALEHTQAELSEMKEKVKKLETQPQLSISAEHMRRLSSLENYSRRWNLILHGLSEKENQDVRRETIRVLQGVLPEARDKIPGAVDTIHRLGPKRPDSARCRPIIIQFAYRIHKDAIWAAAKEGDNPFLLANKLKLSLDFSPETRERRRQLWPQVDQARKEHKRAYYVGGRAFIDGVEIFPP